MLRVAGTSVNGRTTHEPLDAPIELLVQSSDKVLYRRGESFNCLQSYRGLHA